MQEFADRIAVVTGAGTGIGRALALQLAGEGCHLALGDIVEDSLAETVALCREASSGTTVSGHRCDVSDDSQVQQLAAGVVRAHGTRSIDLLINNAGISGGGSFVECTREEWERTFDICWSGVYLVTRAFLPMLLRSRDGHIVNMSSANALRAVLGGHVPHTAYSAAKFAVRGFSEALIHDFRFNAPHLGVSVVMPGHTGTEIMTNSARILGQPQPEDWQGEDLERARRRWSIAGRDVTSMDDAAVRAAGAREIQDMRELGLAPADAARIILDGVRRSDWRILIGDDTVALDELVRASPETAYDPDFVERWRDAYRKLVDSKG